jgi:hypothetical protein
VVLLKTLIDEGTLGRIFHYRAQFLQDWTISADLPQGGEGLWRLDIDVDQLRPGVLRAGSLHRKSDRHCLRWRVVGVVRRC